MRRIRTLVAALASAAALACGAAPAGPADATAGDAAGDAPLDGEVTDVISTVGDHTVPRLDTLADFLAWAGPEHAPAQVKFVIRGFDGEAPVTHLLESGFYEMHDEWSWFRLLNGWEIPGYAFPPMKGLSFATVAEVVAWAREQPTLPYDLEFKGTRLYSERFYSESLVDPRSFGIGSVLHYDADSRRKLPGELWLFELEFLDLPDAATLGRFFDRLEPALPDGVAGKLMWLARSHDQVEFARKLKAEGHPLGPRVAFYDDIMVPGDSKAYNTGLAAGRVVILPAGQSPAGRVGPADLVVLEEVPDDIPPVAAIVSSVPETPLAHVALLAKARGTPNLYLGAASKDPQIQTWAYYHRPVAIEVAEGGHRFREMTEEQWTAYRAMLQTPQVAIPQVDLEGAPEVVDPLAFGFDDMPELVPLVGGKSAGFVALAAWPEFHLPDAPLALTIKGYKDFLEYSQVGPALRLLLADDAFAADARMRLLLLEGREAFEEALGASEPDYIAKFQARYDETTVPGWVHARGGIRQMILDAPMDPGYLGRVAAALEARFAHLAPSQGLRFRSSSTAEDVEGFNGAGLYESHTGFLHPEHVPGKEDRTIERAIRKVWASYWLYGAFEERRVAGIDHLSGNMGMVVHPVFDDDRELSNAVATLELVRRPGGDEVTLVANVQKGALSVTNPGGTSARPEVDEVHRVGDAPPEVIRRQASTEVSPGELLVSDAELIWLHDALSSMAARWLDLRNAALAPPQAGRVVTLDVEFRRMAAGWPSFADGTIAPERLVLKQVRTLEAPARVDAGTKSMPIPRDLLPRVARVQTRACSLGDETVEVTEVLTDPSRPWPFDHSRVPFDAWTKLHALKAWAMHTEATFDHPGMAEGGPWSIDIRPHDPVKTGFARVRVDPAGGWSIETAGGTTQGSGATCSIAHTWFRSPQAFLLDLLSTP